MFQWVVFLLGSMTLGMGNLITVVDSSIPQTIHNVAVQVMPAEGRLSSDFGFRVHPINRGTIFHNGVDIANVRSTPIDAAGAGRVTRVEYGRGYGLTIEIDHGHGWTTRYAHLSAADVKVGDSVGAGTPIGKMGASGSATGNHLHFEVRRYSFAVNPTPYLSAVIPAFAANR